jgi:hypothetical protein
VKKNSLFLFFLIAIFFVQAQRSEVGALIGTSFYLGDLNSMPFKDAQFAGGFIYRYNFTPRISLKTNILFGKIVGTDEHNHSLLRDDFGNFLWDYKDERGLSFSSPLTEIAAQLELNFFNIYQEGHKNQVSPYLFGGAALFSFNPQAVHKEIIYDLQPIGTEGQGRDGMPNKYKLTGFAIPFGIGFKANIGRFICVGAEWGLRFTLTDHLDDVGGLYYDFSNADISSTTYEIVQELADPAAVKHSFNSQRYSTLKSDWYSFAGIVVTVRIGNEDRNCFLKTNVKLKNNRVRIR